MTREAGEGEFRSNLHRGGVAVKTRLSKLERDVARKATKQLGLSVAGVDILRCIDGPKVLEVNSSPGLEGIEKTTGRDIASMIFDFVERKVRVLARHREGRSRAVV